jgi:hypothetical protein
MDLSFAEALIASPGDATTQMLYKGSQPGVFWVDWREGDDDIIKLAARALGRDDLAPHWENGVLHVNFAGRLTPVPLEQKPGEQDITLAALNRALHPAFELRWIRASDGGDTLAFQILPGVGWRALQARYGAAVDAAFARLDPSRPLFAPPSAEDQVTMAASVRAAFTASAPGAAAALCAAARFRLLPASSPLLTRAEVPPLFMPLAGDLCLAFESVDNGVPRLLAADDLRAANHDPMSLQQQAVNNHAPEWQGLSDSGNGVISRLHTGDGRDTSSLIMHPGLWAHFASKGYRQAVAFPRRDLLLWCDATDAVALAALRAMVEAFDPAAPDTLSRQLYRWDQGRWLVLDKAPHERALRDLPLWQAAEQGDLTAQYQVASFHDTATHYAEAVRRYQRIAEQVKATPVQSTDMFANGSAALCNLADKYEHGKGVAQDFKQARQLYMRSAAMGNAVAQYSLGMLYCTGRGVAVDLELGFTWLIKSAQQGYTPASEQLKRIEDARRSAPRRP